MRHTFYLVIFLTICPKLVLIYIEQKIANWTKANIEVSFLKNSCLKPKNVFQKMYGLKRFVF